MPLTLEAVASDGRRPLCDWWLVAPVCDAGSEGLKGGNVGEIGRGTSRLLHDYMHN